MWTLEDTAGPRAEESDLDASTGMQTRSALLCSVPTLRKSRGMGTWKQEPRKEVPVPLLLPPL